MIALRILLLSLGLLLAPVSRAERLVVIVSADTPVQRLSLKQLQRIYLRKALLGPGNLLWRPLNLPASHPLRLAFSRLVLHRDPGELEEYWNIRYFQGVLPPYVVASEEAMQRYVAAIPGAVGYLRACRLDATGIRIIATLEILESLPCRED